MKQWRVAATRSYENLWPACHDYVCVPQAHMTLCGKQCCILTNRVCSSYKHPTHTFTHTHTWLDIKHTISWKRKYMPHINAAVVKWRMVRSKRRWRQIKSEKQKRCMPGNHWKYHQKWDNRRPKHNHKALSWREADSVSCNSQPVSRATSARM